MNVSNMALSSRMLYWRVVKLSSHIQDMLQSIKIRNVLVSCKNITERIMRYSLDCLLVCDTDCGQRARKTK